MGVLEKALSMLEKHALCDHCLGRQFALLGRGLENDARGKALKLSLTLQASSLSESEKDEDFKRLNILADNGFSREAQSTLEYMGKSSCSATDQTKCFLCEDKFQSVDKLVDRAREELTRYEYTTFLVGVELPVSVEEREDEFKAEFEVTQGESVRHEFGRLFGKAIAEQTNKEVDYMKPEVVAVFNPFVDQVRVQVNPLFIRGRYRKLVRDIPQSKWFCSGCRGKGCEKCNWTGKLYPESVEELVSKPLLTAAEGEKTAFHASGREDIDARMLGTGRPFVLEISKPRKRFLDLKKLETEVNACATGKVKVSKLRFTNKDVVRRLKKGESAQKEYRMLVEFERSVSAEDLHLLEEKLTGASVKQQTPLRVLHRRADLVREKYIYKVKVKKRSPKRAELEIRCQGGLYVKELMSGDEGRTVPNVSELLGNKAKPLKLDVLSVKLDD
jgi:tRNA pseudouridine synthase 10